MRKLLIAALLLLPVAAYAECGFARSDSELTIVVGKDPKCLSSGAFREALKSNILAALAEEEARTDQKRAYDDRNARGAKLWAIAERRHQEVGARYFGQRR